MNVLIDTGFWYAFYDESDELHSKAVEMMPHIEKHRILIPYPSLYETINTRFSRRKEWMNSLKSFIASPACVLIQDDDYKRETLKMTLDSSVAKSRPISLVDMVIRQMLDDVNLKSDAIVTFNPDDFSDVCRKRGKILVTEIGMMV